MRRLLFLPFIVLLFISCSDSKPNKLEDAIILSLQKSDFNLLKGFLPDKKFYETVTQQTPKKTDKEIEDLLTQAHFKIKQAWQRMIQIAGETKVDLNKVVLKEAIYYDPFPKDEVSEALIINYDYKGNTWDDLQFIVSRNAGRTVLLDIPNPTKAFSMLDTERKGTADAKARIEMDKPEFKKNIEDLTNKLITAAMANNLDEFGKYLVYRGDDQSKRWKAAVNMSDSLERKDAAQFMERFNKSLASCSNYKNGDVRTEKESEGLWIIWPLDCGDKIFSLAYLKINGQLLLGDTDSEAK